MLDYKARMKLYNQIAKETEQAHKEIDDFKKIKNPSLEQRQKMLNRCHEQINRFNKGRKMLLDFKIE